MKVAGMIGIASRNALFCGALAVVGMGARAAAAEPSSSGNSVAAQALFDEAKRLMQQGDAASACPKFEESQRLEPGVGTKLNLANCYERIGRTASAWILFLEVESDTKRNGQTERQTMAHNRASALQPKLSRVTIDVPQPNRVEGLSVERDGVEVGAAQWGLSIPVDPGSHTIQAHAPGKKDWQTTITVPADASTQAVSVPLLENAPIAETSATPNASHSSSGKPASHVQRNASYVALGIGGAGVIIGSIFGLRAVSKNNQSNTADCQGNDCLRGSAGAQDRTDARSAGNISTVAFAIGGAAVATGLVLFFTEPKKEAPSSGQISAGAFASRDGASLTVRGAW
jgi:hypothetical protein